MPTSTPRWLSEAVSLQDWIVRLQDSSELEALPQLLQALSC